MASDSPQTEAWRHDNDFEEYEVKEVELDRDTGERGTWVVKLEFGFILQWPRGAGAPQPKAGQTARVYGDVDGVWGPRGVVIEDKVAYFRTPEEQVEYVKQREAEVYQEAKVLFKEREEEIRERLDLLPDNLRKRVQAARASTDDKEEFDVYELEVEVIKHEHAHMIALVMDSEATLDTFSRIPNQGQMGYSWNAMCDERLAVIEKMLNESDGSEDTLAQLRQDREHLTRYQEQRFIVQHPPEILVEIFEVAAELVQAKIRH